MTALKREIKLGEKNEDMDTWEVLDGLKNTDYIVWPSEDCKKGAAVVKNTAVNNESGISEDELNGTAGTEPEDGTEAEPEDGTSENLQKDGGMEDE